LKKRDSGQPRILWYIAEEYFSHMNEIHRKIESQISAAQAGSSDRGLVLVEAKASRTALPAMADPIKRFMRNVEKEKLSAFVIYQPDHQSEKETALVPDVKAVSLRMFLEKT
jgi:hypothetical protein